MYNEIDTVFIGTFAGSNSQQLGDIAMDINYV